MNYREQYEVRKELYLRPVHSKKVGANAAWAFPFLFHLSYDWWYIPGGARSPAHSYDYEVNVKINFREKNPQKFANDLIDAMKKDLAYWKYDVSDSATDNDFSEIAVYVYNSSSFFAAELEYDYRYFFIRQEPFLKFYTMLYNGAVYEGLKDELVSILKSKYELLATASFYWKE